MNYILYLTGRIMLGILFILNIFNNGKTAAFYFIILICISLIVDTLYYMYYKEIQLDEDTYDESEIEAPTKSHTLFYVDVVLLITWVIIYLV